MTAPAAAPTVRRRVTAWSASPQVLRRLALLSVIVNVGIVVTGGAVRLTNSGLGCPTWPRCDAGSLVPRAKLGINGVIEFSNRTLTVVVGATLALTLLVAWRQRRQVRLAVIALAGVPAQALLGGVVVLTDLNPWLVALHFLLSAAIIAATFLLWWRLGDRPFTDVPAAARVVVRLALAATGLVVVAGTLVTGTGPHAGDLKNGRVHRIDLPITGVVQLHADLVMILIGLTVGMLAVAFAIRSTALQRAAAILFGVELAQGVIGYTQYFLNVPPLLVGLHMLGACLVWIAALHAVAVITPTATVRRLAELDR